MLQTLGVQKYCLYTTPPDRRAVSERAEKAHFAMDPAWGDAVHHDAPSLTARLRGLVFEQKSAFWPCRPGLAQHADAVQLC